MLMARGDIHGVVSAPGRACRRRKMRMGLVRMGVCLGCWRRYIAGLLVGARVGCSHESESIRVALFNLSFHDNDLENRIIHTRWLVVLGLSRAAGLLGVAQFTPENLIRTF